MHCAGVRFRLENVALHQSRQTKSPELLRNTEPLADCLFISNLCGRCECPPLLRRTQRCRCFSLKKNRNENSILEFLVGRLDHTEDTPAAIEYAFANRAEISSDIQLDLGTRRQIFSRRSIVPVFAGSFAALLGSVVRKRA
jgi:hypothetical protein